MSGHREYAGVGVGIDKQLFGVGDDSSSVGSGSGSDEHIEQQERMYEGGSESNNSGNDDQSSEKKPRLARQEPNHILSRQSSTDSSGPDASNRLRYLLGSSGDAILSLPSESEFETHLHVPKRSRRSRPRYTLSVYPSNHNGYNSCGQTPIQEGISSSQGVMVTEGVSNMSLIVENQQLKDENQRLRENYQQASNENAHYQQENAHYQQENAHYQQENAHYQQEIARLMECIHQQMAYPAQAQDGSSTMMHQSMGIVPYPSYPAVSMNSQLQSPSHSVLMPIQAPFSMADQISHMVLNSPNHVHGQLRNVPQVIVHSPLPSFGREFPQSATEEMAQQQSLAAGAVPLVNPDRSIAGYRKPQSFTLTHSNETPMLQVQLPLGHDLSVPQVQEQPFSQPMKQPQQPALPSRTSSSLLRPAVSPNNSQALSPGSPYSGYAAMPRSPASPQNMQALSPQPVAPSSIAQQLPQLDMSNGTTNVTLTGAAMNYSDS